MQRATHVFMNHNDRVSRLPEGFSSRAHTDNCPYAEFADEERGLYGVQFHPEVKHSVEGTPEEIKNNEEVQTAYFGKGLVTGEATK